MYAVDLLLEVFLCKDTGLESVSIHLTFLEEEQEEPPFRGDCMTLLLQKTYGTLTPITNLLSERLLYMAASMAIAQQ